ncbi:MAG: hypothetical protein R8J85_05215 [Mariprofundales bacterium]
MQPLLDQKLVMMDAIFESMRIYVARSHQGEITESIALTHGDGLLSLDDDKLLLSGWKLALYDGEAQVDAMIYPLHHSKKINMDGQVLLDRMQIAPLLDDSLGGHKLSGILNANLQYSISFYPQGDKPVSISLDGPLHLHQGEWLSKRIKRLDATPSSKDQSDKLSTPYQDIAMNIQLRNQLLKATAIRIRANHFYGTGKLRISPDHALHGEIDTSTADGIIGAKMVIMGSIDHPDIYPAPSAAIAGAFGSVVGGPVGAALGIRLGGVIGTMLESTGDALMGMFKSNPNKAIR